MITSAIASANAHQTGSTWVLYVKISVYIDWSPAWNTASIFVASSEASWSRRLSHHEG